MAACRGGRNEAAQWSSKIYYMLAHSTIARGLRITAVVLSCWLVFLNVGCSSNESPSKSATAPAEQKPAAPKAPTIHLSATDKVVGSVDVMKLVPEGDGKPKEVVAAGWAASADANAPIAVIALLVNGKTLGTTTPTESRADVAEAFGRPDFATAGWKFELPVGKLGPGKHKVTVKVTNSKGDSLVLPGASLTLD